MAAVLPAAFTDRDWSKCAPDLRYYEEYMSATEK